MLPTWANRKLGMSRDADPCLPRDDKGHTNSKWTWTSSLWTLLKYHSLQNGDFSEIPGLRSEVQIIYSRSRHAVPSISHHPVCRDQWARATHWNQAPRHRGYCHRHAIRANYNWRSRERRKPVLKGAYRPHPSSQLPKKVERSSHVTSCTSETEGIQLQDNEDRAREDLGAFDFLRGWGATSAFGQMYWVDRKPSCAHVDQCRNPSGGAWAEIYREWGLVPIEVQCNHRGGMDKLSFQIPDYRS